MKSLYQFTLIAMVAALLAGCQKYVDIKTQGQLTPGDITNYRYLLNNTSAYELGTRMGDVASDDVNIIDGSTQQQQFVSYGAYYAWFPLSYTWQAAYPVTSTYYNDAEWNAMYNTILYCNTVTTEVPTSTGGTDAQKAELLAEALVHRADAYLMLVNSYAKPYNAATSASDPGVPLLLTETTVQSLVRAPVQNIYNQIIADLKKAIPALLTTQAFNTIPTKASAYGELARTYLYMNDYASASLYADSALAIKSTLNDLAPLTAVSSANYPLRKNDPEILLSKIPVNGYVNYSPTVFRLSDDLLNLLGTKDQRYNLFTCPASKISSTYTAAGGRFFYREMAIGEARNIGPSVPEMMLIKAENFARKGDAGSAMTWVNALRKKRFKTTDYADLTATSANDALAKVIDERHREFFCRMLRWWDMRRLKSETQFQKTYTRTYAGVTYTLDPNSNKYTFQIAGYVIGLNPEIVQNP
ncbi:RagB/SusD family nutrient uptake outer membrane protein [Mucilaginibacter sp. KACC 22063]|uniref:RagB/SusD family nutrient uptake outer membrane protein n=1 Tax=Mucilaginibacter sp. KACC 22063 TaxID=3025666 RepID=UPI002364FE82|nr:RagB/SusD family nutrient uptake outer membrane protein [Mucilaginibacter sp. KACC 22063]WDF55832.1 RagB/SusD family nutrient uptake outer membrane protein [Mucilaginibacter sp. KACC 22063]